MRLGGRAESIKRVSEAPPPQKLDFITWEGRGQTWSLAGAFRPR